MLNVNKSISKIVIKGGESRTRAQASALNSSNVRSGSTSYEHQEGILTPALTVLQIMPNPKYTPHRSGSQVSAGDHRRSGGSVKSQTTMQ